MVIYFYFEKPIGLKNRKKLKKFIASVFVKEGRKLGSLNIIFCSDERLLEINKSFLNHHFFTDIITFDLSENGAHSIDAEIYISTDRVRDNAVLFDTTITRELHRVIFHGVLHLCGYKDKSASSQKLMRKKEDEYLRGFFGE